MITQEIVNPPAGTATSPEIPIEIAPRPTIAKAVKEITAAGTDTIGNRLDEAVIWWRNLPRERQILFEFVGLSVLASFTMATVAALIARIFEKR